MDYDIYDDSLNDAIYNRRPLPEDEEDNDFINYCEDSDRDYPEAMEYYGQINLAKLKSLREQLNWENEEERYPFYLRLSKLLRDWKGKLPNLKDIFRKEEIDWFLMEALINRKKTVRNWRGQFFVDFVVSSGYKDEPDVDKNGNPILHRSTPVHLAAKQNLLRLTIHLSEMYEKDVNYIDESGFTYFHALCKIGRYEKVKKFLELGQDPNCLVTETGESPLHLALYPGLWAKEMMGLLLKRGANPNLADKDGWTPLHMICKSWNYCTSGDVANTFFEITEANHQTIQIDAKDKLGRTPLQLAVAGLRPDLVHVLLDRGADLSSFVFPTEDYFAKEWKPDEYYKSPNWYFLLASSVLAVVERLEKRGYELDRSGALTIMKYFATEFFKKPVDYNIRFSLCLSGINDNCMFTPNMSLYDLIRSRPEEAEKLLTYSDCWKFAVNQKYWYYSFQKEHRTASAMYLCDLLLKRFFRRWALEPLLELTRHYQLPILCCEIIIKKLANEDLMNMRFAVTDKGEA